MLAILRFFTYTYWQRRENTLEKKRTWRKSIKFFNLTGTKTKPPVLPDERLNFNETQKFIQNEAAKFVISDDRSHTTDLMQ